MYNICEEFIYWFLRKIKQLFKKYQGDLRDLAREEILPYMDYAKRTIMKIAQPERKTFTLVHR